MADDKKKRDKKMEKQQETQEEQKPKEYMPGERGMVGQGTPATKLKKLWHQACFTRTDANHKHNPHKKFWKKNRNTPSLKAFVKSLLNDETNGATAKRWLDSKLGKFDQKRTDKNKARITLEKQASKSARKKKSGGKGGATKAPAAA